MAGILPFFDLLLQCSALAATEPVWLWFIARTVASASPCLARNAV